LGVYWSLEDNRARKLWLLFASYVFYAAWDWRFLSLILISTLVDYLVGLGLARAERQRARRALVTTSLVANLGMLGFFKYFGFFVDSAIQLGEWLGFAMSRPALEIVLPVGISFYTFQTLSYSIDVYRRQIEPTRNLLDLALFVAFFPQLVAGPIVRAASFLPQLHSLRSWAEVRAAPLLALFLFGFVKKACISDNVASTVDAYFSAPQVFDAASAWLAILLYAIQIYCDFSGYSDMAIASAGLLGYQLGPNFRWPYLAANLREFWQRWHISLSTWLRDYLYIPLGGSRGASWKTYRNLLLTMTLGGLWHGAAWHFVLWGALHGVALALYRAFDGWPKRREAGADRSPTRIGLVVSVLATQYFVCFAWILFRAQDLDRALVTARSYLLFDSPGDSRIDPRWWLLVLGFAAVHALGPRWLRADVFASWPRWAFVPAYGAAIAIALLFTQVDVQPFIYFQF
ncbi:MAG TPA: MBOAT family O-acyltransferase, partial [Thermoanaerobaculia bacterium]|nr:MBOAT family O-acyltransferase [Thermoanaerobaculia bacterium]